MRECIDEQNGGIETDMVIREVRVGQSDPKRTLYERKTGLEGKVRNQLCG